MKLHWLGIIGIVAALLGGLGDLLMLYNPEGGYEKQDYMFLMPIETWRVIIGYYLGVIFIPLQLIGFGLVYHALRPAGRKLTWPIIFTVVYILIIGVVYHAMLGGLAQFMHLKKQTFIDTELFQLTLNHYRMILEPLSVVLYLSFIVGSSGLGYLIQAGKTAYPKWANLFNPLLTHLVFLSIYIVNKPIGSALLITGLNFSLLILFLLSVILFWNKTAKDFEISEIKANT